MKFVDGRAVELVIVAGSLRCLGSWGATQGPSSCRTQGWDILRVPFEPQCEVASLRPASILVVDGTSDLGLAVAECTRLQVVGAPVVLVSHEELSRSALQRAGIGSVVPSDVSLSEFEDAVSSLLRVSRRDSGVMLASSATVALNELVVIDRARRLLLVDGREEVLSAQKFELLCYLVEKAGVAVGAQELVKCGLLRPSQASRLKGLVQELRARLGPARDLISAVPGYGYRFHFQVESLPAARRRT